MIEPMLADGAVHVIRISDPAHQNHTHASLAQGPSVHVRRQPYPIYPTDPIDPTYEAALSEEGSLAIAPHGELYVSEGLYAEEAKEAKAFLQQRLQQRQRLESFR